MRRRVHLVGPFRAFHDGPIEIVADTIWDAVEAVTSQIKGFAPDPINGRKRIQVAGCDRLEDLKRYDTTTEDIYILPALAFGKDSGLIQTVIGVTLIVVGIAMGGTFWPALFISMGISLTIGGLTQMLTPQPQLNVNNEDQLRSRYLGGIQNTVKIGTPIPLLYGRYRAGGHLLSLNIDAVDTGI